MLRRGGLSSSASGGERSRSWYTKAEVHVAGKEGREVVSRTHLRSCFRSGQDETSVIHNAWASLPTGTDKGHGMIAGVGTRSPLVVFSSRVFSPGSRGPRALQEEDRGKKEVPMRKRPRGAWGPNHTPHHCYRQGLHLAIHHPQRICCPLLGGLP